MKILLTNNHLDQLGGTETWVITMAKYLQKIGHDVGVYIKRNEKVLDIINDIRDDNPKGYDLALINHNACINVDAKFKIQTSHGTVPEMEKPSPDCDVNVAINNYVANHHNIDTIIRNPIDTRLFRPKSNIGIKPERKLAITHVSPPIEVIRATRKDYNVSELINNSDLVVSIGRGMLEAMSCGRNVIVWDNRSYRGECGLGYLSNPEDSWTFANKHYDNTKIKINWEEELNKYNPEDGARNRQYILDNHSVENIAQQYLDIYNKNQCNEKV